MNASSTPTCFKIKFVKIEFENSIRRFSFLCRLTDIKIVWINPCAGSSVCLTSAYTHCTENRVFFFRTSWKDGLSKKNPARTWSLLYYRKRWYFFFPKTWTYSIDGKRKMIFLEKNSWKCDIFYKCSEKMVFSKMLHWDMIFLVLSGKIVYFFRENIFFPWTENERWSFSRNTWKYDIFFIYV